MFLTEEEREQFLTEFSLKEKDIREALLSWTVLEEIVTDFCDKKSEHSETLAKYEKEIRQCEYVHSSSYRVKDPYHLAEKIIRKNAGYVENGESISKSNYEDKITDLLGMRILVLFKEDWIKIHDFLFEHYGANFAERPFAYVRKGDDVSIYNGKVDIKDPRAYRSVHYLIKTGGRVTIELQVRTLYEEAWGEIDHRIRYPYNMSNKMIESYSNIMNRLTGMADEMGSFINEYYQRFDEGRKASFMDNNAMYQYVLERIDRCDDEDVRKEIKDTLMKAEDYKTMKSVSDMFDNFMHEI